MGTGKPFDAIPYFFTDQYELGMEYTGYVNKQGFDNVVFRGDRASGEFMVFWQRGGNVLAGMGINVWDQMPNVAELIRRGSTVAADRLADPDVPLTELVA